MPSLRSKLIGNLMIEEKLFRRKTTKQKTVSYFFFYKLKRKDSDCHPAKKMSKNRYLSYFLKVSLFKKTPSTSNTQHLTKQIEGSWKFFWVCLNTIYTEGFQSIAKNVGQKLLNKFKNRVLKRHYQATHFWPKQTKKIQASFFLKVVFF